MKISKKIVGYTVNASEQKNEAPEVVKADVIQMHETLKRPDMLVGTEHEMRRPFEVFINSKNLDHHQWIVALTRIMSAVFRKGGDVTFLVEELRSVFDPRGGYWNNGSYMWTITRRN